MKAKTPVTTAERTLVVHARPVIHFGQPLMQQFTGTLVTCTPDTHMTAKVNLYLMQELLVGMVPLLL